jgi:hypothetical protein
MEELHGHTLEYWKNNAEEDYLKVPISVLKYITCLEERIEQLTIPVVVKSFYCNSDDGEYNNNPCSEQCIFCKETEALQ